MNGGLLGLVSGGRLTRDPEKTRQETQNLLQQQAALLQEQQNSQLEQLHNQFKAMGYSDEHVRESMAIYEQQFQQQREQFQTQIQSASAMSRKISRDVLYLMIVNLPTEEEMEAAKIAISDKSDDGAKMVNV